MTQKQAGISQALMRVLDKIRPGLTKAKAGVGTVARWTRANPGETAAYAGMAALGSGGIYSAAQLGREQPRPLSSAYALHKANAGSTWMGMPQAPDHLWVGGKQSALTQKQASLQTFIARALSKLRAGAGTAGAWGKNFAQGAGTQAAELTGKTLGVSPHQRIASLALDPFRQAGTAAKGGFLGQQLKVDPFGAGRLATNTAVAATPVALLAQALTDKNAAFLEGFQQKCAELGVDPLPLIKAAQLGSISIIGKPLARVIRAVLPQGMENTYDSIRRQTHGHEDQGAGLGQRLSNQFDAAWEAVKNPMGFTHDRNELSADVANINN